MTIPYEKMPTDENPSSSMVSIDEQVQVHDAPVRIRHYFVFSLFSAICLCPATGLIALAYSLKSSAKADVKFHDKARLYARRALLWNLISVILIALFFIMVFVFFYYVSQSVRVYEPMTDPTFIMSNSEAMNNDVNRMIQSITNEQ